MATVDPSAVGLIGSAVAVASAATAWMTARVTQRRGRADADGVIVASAERVVALMDGRLAVLARDAELAAQKCEREIAALRRRVVLLEHKLRTAGIPIPTHEES